MPQAITINSPSHPLCRPCLLAAAVVASCAGLASAQSQFIINGANVLTNGGQASSYVGPSTGGADLRGAVADGGLGAYNIAGGVFFAPDLFAFGSAPAGLAVSRRTDTLQSLNVFRWVVTLTNTTSAPITTPVAFWTQIGYDGPNNDVTNTSYRFVTYEQRVLGTVVQFDIPGDPVIGMMHGNNAFTGNNISWQRDPNDVRNVIRTWNLDLAPGQSQTVMFADFLAYQLDANGFAGGGGSPNDITLVLNTTQSYLTNATALFAGLDGPTIASISNWTFFGIPTPGATGALALGLLAASRRRR